MKRKVIQLAGKTLVISLPSAWAKEYGVKKGDELEIETKERELIVNSTNSIKFSKIRIDISGFEERFIRWTLSALHKKGYDEIEIKFDSDEQLIVILDLLKNLFLGFAVVKQNESTCVIRSITQELSHEFDITLKRAFQVTISMGESIIEFLESEQYTLLKSLIALENTNNQLTNFCERIINKGRYTQKKDSHFMYVIAWNLEKVCDEYKYICQKISEKDLVDKDSIDKIRRTNDLLTGYYGLFYGFNLKSVNELTKKRKRLSLDIEKSIEKSKDKNKIILYHTYSLVYKIADFSSSIIAINT